MSVQQTTETAATTINPVTGATEVVRTLRNFRSTPDIENFYRFINEHSLRREAKLILETIFSSLNAETKKQNRKKKKLAKKLQ